MARPLIHAGRFALLAALAGCAAPHSYPERPVGASGPIQEPRSVEEWSETDWLARAEQAEDRAAWEEAALYLDRALLGQSPDQEWFERRAVAAERSGDYETAVAMREELFHRRPKDLMARIDLADDLQRAGRGLEGVMLLEAAATDPETSIFALRALGELHERDGRPLEAAESYERLAADERVSGRRILLQNASRLREEGGDIAGSLRDLELALEGLNLAEEEREMLSRVKAFETGEPENVADAVALMTLHPDAEFRLTGARYLTYGRFPDDVVEFGRAVQDEDPRVARLAVREVAARGRPGDASYLLSALRSPDAEVRLAAVRGLGAVGTPAEVPLLLSLLEPEDRAQFRAARASLEEITGHSIGIELDPDAERRAEIAVAWREWWETRGQGDGAPR